MGGGRRGRARSADLFRSDKDTELAMRPWTAKDTDAYQHRPDGTATLDLTQAVSSERRAPA